MFLHVQGKVIGPCEGPLAHPARIRPNSCVFPHVPSQLVRPRELPSAALPLANIGLLPRVRSQVRLHVARLVVRLAAGGVWALVEHWGLPQVASLPPHQQGRGHGVHLGRVWQGTTGESAVVLVGLLLLVVLLVRVDWVRLDQASEVCLALVACRVVGCLVWGVTTVQVQDMVWASLSLWLDRLVVGIDLVGLICLLVT